MLVSRYFDDNDGVWVAQWIAPLGMIALDFDAPQTGEWDRPDLKARFEQEVRQRWLHLALGAGQRFTGLMALPDDRLPFGVGATHDLPVGECIFTGYPLRYWGDLRIVRNAGGSRIQRGVVWMSHDTAAAIGRDFDGDYVQLVPADDYPALTAEIRSWADRPEVEIVKVKERLASPLDQESLARVMLDNAGNLVGIIALLIARAVASGRLDLVPRLVQELQISVDRFKYNVGHDHDFLEAVGETLPEVAWLQDRKRMDAYLSRPMYVQSGDTVGRLVRKANAFWKAPGVLARSLEEYAALLPEPDRYAAQARALNARYGRLIGQALDGGDGDELSRIFKALREWAEGVEEPEQWARAVWHAVHKKGATGCGSLPFRAFHAEIAKVLKEAEAPQAGKVAIVGLGYNDYADSLSQFDGSAFAVKFALRPFIGAPSMDFELFRQLGGNFYTNILASIGEILGFVVVR